MERGFLQRMRAIERALERKERVFSGMSKNGVRTISQIFGKHAFDFRKMKERFSEEVFQELKKIIKEGNTLSPEIAQIVAHAVKEWALEQGCTHFSHWFHPQTGATAEKHDAFLDFDQHHLPMERFTGAQLVQSEPDASSFPSGGMRTTFEARGYTAWDPSSPIFIMEMPTGKTLCIPSVFISYHGQALDEKAALLKSMEVLNKESLRLLRFLGEKYVKRVLPTLGPEQEYFLIDQAYYEARPDLVMCGRVLLGQHAPRGQQLEDHYFGSIPQRVMAFMNEAEWELYRLGVPVKTRHNEVAPSQYEIATIFEDANIATDHNQIVMEVLRKVARRHRFQLLLSEKPFEELNGNGKHCNWSFMTLSDHPKANRMNLLDPGESPEENLRFLLFLLGVIRGVQKHERMLRASVVSAGNDFRLGANEAPPAILSVFLGSLLKDILNKFSKGRGAEVVMTEGGKTGLHIGISHLPEILRDNTDRNRTSPFAFTGNRFEFRAVGGSFTTAFPVTILNVAAADGIAEVVACLEKQKEISGDDSKAIDEVLKHMSQQTASICFEGNNYGEKWIEEAKKRGLSHLRTTPEALPELISENALALFKKYRIYTEKEIQGKYKVKLSRYIKTRKIENTCLIELIDTYVLPSAIRYLGNLFDLQKNTKKLVLSLTSEIEILIQKLQDKNKAMKELLEAVKKEASGQKKAMRLAQEGVELQKQICMLSNQLESKLPNDYWPLPKMREMLYLH